MDVCDDTEKLCNQTGQKRPLSHVGVAVAVAVATFIVAAAAAAAAAPPS